MVVIEVLCRLVMENFLCIIVMMIVLKELIFVVLIGVVILLKSKLRIRLIKVRGVIRLFRSLSFFFRLIWFFIGIGGFRFGFN